MGEQAGLNINGLVNKKRRVCVRQNQPNWERVMETQNCHKRGQTMTYIEPDTTGAKNKGWHHVYLSDLCLADAVGSTAVGANDDNLKRTIVERTNPTP